MTQPSVILKANNAADIDPGGVLSFPMNGLTAADLLAGQTVYLTVYSREFTGLATAISDTSADVTWPADAPYPLPPGEYNCEFQTSAPKGLPADVSQAAAQSAVVLVAQAVDPATIDLPGLATAYNTCVAAHDELATAFNGLLASLQAANLMAPAAPAALTAKSKAKK